MWVRGVYQTFRRVEQKVRLGAAHAGLIDRIRSGHAVLFAGAGCSIPAGYPSWTRLLEELEDLCDRWGVGFVRDPAGRASELAPEYADRIKAHLEAATGSHDRYYKFIGSRFGRSPALTAFHSDLVALPFCGMLTTNYDSVLEAALLTSPRDRSLADRAVVPGVSPPFLEQVFRRSLNVVGGPRMVAHIHGHYTSPDRVVLGAADYRRVYGIAAIDEARQLVRFKPVTEFVRPILQMRSLVFVGFSLRDPDFSALLESMSIIGQTWGDDEHYALLGTDGEDPQADRDREIFWRERYSVQVVYYPTRGNDHSSLSDLIASLRQRLAPSEERSIVAEPSLDDLNRRFMEETRE